MMAVNLANLLAEIPNIQSYLVVSRLGGMLQSKVNPGVKVVMLHKTKKLDIAAMWRFVRFAQKEKINLVHVHCNSLVYPALLKIFCRYRLIWHDHYGLPVNRQTGKRGYPVKPFVASIDFAFAVNQQLLETDIRFFHFSPQKIAYLPNFSVSSNQPNAPALPPLQGTKADRIVCLANLRPQKDHPNLLAAFAQVLAQRPHTYLYLVGLGMADAYQQQIEETIATQNLQQNVYWLGPLQNPMEMLQQASIGVLSSASEGLPLALIEYGLAHLAVASTAVGEIPAMITPGTTGLLVPPGQPAPLAAALLQLLQQPEAATLMAQNFARQIHAGYSAQGAMQVILNQYHKLCPQ